MSSSNDIASAFVFVYTTTGEYKGRHPTLDQRTFYDSYTKELVVADVSLPPDPTKIINLSDSDENKLKQTIRDNNLFSTKEVYYTNALDVYEQRLYVILDGKVHSVHWNVLKASAWDPIPQGLEEIIKTIKGMISSK
ncbi:MAG TPA: hypothetical protein VFY64_05240 [Nitrososphaeraceae archaeon]|nr:hypothetical protein [Nitrososphaeraceae archaeon]